MRGRVPEEAVCEGAEPMPAIELQGVVKTFGPIRAVDGLDLSVPEGICLGLLGPNGAGKSTTMRLLTGQAIADSGSLRALGFYVPRVVRSNYLHTLLSLPSLLNAAHLTALEQEIGAKVKHPRLPNYLLEHARVIQYLQQRGYEYVFFPSDWWHSTRSSPPATLRPTSR